MLQLDRATVDSCLYRLRKDPESADVRAGLFKSLAPIIRAYSSHCCLTATTAERLVRRVEELLVQQLPDVVASWFARPNACEGLLLRRIKRAVVAAVISFPADPLARIVEDDLKLEQLRVWRREGDVDAVGRVLVGALAAALVHFGNQRGRRFLGLAEKSVYSLALHGRRPRWRKADAERWGGHEFHTVMEVFTSYAAPWVRESVAEVLEKKGTPA